MLLMFTHDTCDLRCGEHAFQYIVSSSNRNHKGIAVTQADTCQKIPQLPGAL